MRQTGDCSICGSPKSDDSPNGRCPACLLKGAPDGDTTLTEAPPPTEGLSEHPHNGVRGVPDQEPATEQGGATDAPGSALPGETVPNDGEARCERETDAPANAEGETLRERPDLEETEGPRVPGEPGTVQMEPTDAPPAADTLLEPEHVGKSGTTLGPVPGPSGPVSTVELSAPGETETLVPPNSDSEATVELVRPPEEANGIGGYRPMFSRRAEYPTVPGYEIRGVLGVGGMGIVYEALQVRADRLVALKMIRGDAQVNSEQLDRFRVEARAVAHLRHPNIVQIHDVGEVDGLPYFSIEYLNGGSLKSRLGAALMPHRDAAELMAVLARAIDSAHRAGIVHRDLKPANVLFDIDGTPKVADFGLAKRLEEQGQTMTGQVMGTPSYMAPEQARGDNRAVGPLADVCALGAMFYEMLTGRPPFQGTNVTETLMMVVYHEPVAPSKRVPKVSRDLETICLKCLAKDPSRRYVTAGALAEDLELYLAGRPIKARPTPAWERAAKWARRRPVAAAAVGFVLLSAGVLGIAAERYSAGQRARTRRLAATRLEGVADLGRARVQLARGELTESRQTLKVLSAYVGLEPRLAGLRQQTDLELRNVERRLDEEAGRAMTQQRFNDFRRLRDEALLLDGYTGFFAEVPPPDEGSDGAATPEEASARPAKPDLSPREGPTVRTRKAARTALGVFAAKGAAPGAVPETLPATLTAAQQAEVKSDSYLLLMVLSEAVARPVQGEDPARQGAEALGCLDQAAGLHASTPAYHLRRAACLERMGDETGARGEREKASQLKAEEAFDHFLLGRELYQNGDWDAAAAHFDAALRKQPESFWARCLLATAQLNNVPPRAAEAKTELTACLIKQPKYAWLYLLRGSANGQLGDAWATAGRKSDENSKLLGKAQERFEEAEEDFQHALELGLDADLNYVLLMNRGVMRFQQGKPEAAAMDFEHAIAFRKGQYNAYVSLAQVYRKLGRGADAIELISKAIALRPQMPALYRARAVARLEAERLSPSDGAATLHDLEESARLALPNRREAAEDHVRRGRLLLRLDRPSEAVTAANAALALIEGLPQAHVVRVAALLELERYDEVISSCDAALASETKTPELYRLRGLARAGRNDFGGAVDDYTHALAHDHPNSAEVYRNRGWSYLYTNAFALARRDFDAVLRQDSNDADAYAGRAAALVRLGLTGEAVHDIEEGLRRAKTSARIAYVAAQTYALASSRALGEALRTGRPASRDSLAYEARCADLLEECLARTPADQKRAFWQKIVASDQILRPILKNPVLLRRLKPRDGSKQ